MDTLYRIYTEDINRETITDLVLEAFSSFTLLTGTGFYVNVTEPTLVVEIVAHANQYANVKGIASKIRDYNKQESVLVTKSTIESELV